MHTKIIVRPIELNYWRWDQTLAEPTGFTANESPALYVIKYSIFVIQTTTENIH